MLTSWILPSIRPPPPPSERATIYRTHKTYILLGLLRTRESTRLLASNRLPTENDDGVDVEREAQHEEDEFEEAKKSIISLQQRRGCWKSTIDLNIVDLTHPFLTRPYELNL